MDIANDFGTLARRLDTNSMMYAFGILSGFCIDNKRRSA